MSDFRFPDFHRSARAAFEETLNTVKKKQEENRARRQPKKELLKSAVRIETKRRNPTLRCATYGVKIGDLVFLQKDSSEAFESSKVALAVVRRRFLSWAKKRGLKGRRFNFSSKLINRVYHVYIVDADRKSEIDALELDLVRELRFSSPGGGAPLAKAIDE